MIEFAAVLANAFVSGDLRAPAFASGDIVSRLRSYDGTSPAIVTRSILRRAGQ